MKQSAERNKVKNKNREESMSDKDRIFSMVEAKIISADEAIRMLQALGLDESKKGKGDVTSEEKEGEGFEAGGDFGEGFREWFGSESDSESDSEFESRKQSRSREKFAIHVGVNSMDIIVKPSENCDKVTCQFVDADTGEVMDIPESVDVYDGADRFTVKENFFKNFGPKMASGTIGRKMIDIFGLNAQDKFKGSLYIDIPARMMIGEAKFSTKSGDIVAKGVNTVENLVLSSLSGDISISHAICDRFSVNAVSGDVRIDDLMANSVGVTEVSGDVKFVGKTPEIDVNCVSGDVEIVNDMLLYHSRLNSVSGDIKVYVPDEERQNYSVTGMFKAKSMKGRTDGEGGTSLKLNSVSGSIKLYDRSRYES